MALDNEGRLSLFGLTSISDSKEEISQVIEEAKSLGILEGTEGLAVSNRVALRLLEDGALKIEQFENATEGINASGLEFIKLDEIDFNGAKYSLFIFSEKEVGPAYIGFVDKEGKMEVI